MTTEPRGIGPIRVFACHLEEAKLQPLKRPFFTPASPRTKEIVQWGIWEFTYSVAAHLRMILVGLRDLGEKGNNPACGPLARHLFEWTAVMCYLSDDLRARFDTEDWQGAWDTLTPFAIGSAWIRKYGNLYAEFPVERNCDVPVPPAIKKSVAAYDQFLKESGRGGSALEEYSHLCDHSHPTSACLVRYRQNDLSTNTTTFEMLIEQENIASFLPVANVSCVDLFTFMRGMLSLAGESSLNAALWRLLEQVAQRRSEHPQGAQGWDSHLP